MKKVIAALTLLVFFACASPAHSMPVVFSCVVPQDSSRDSSPLAHEFSPAPYPLINRDLFADEEKAPLRSSIIEIPSFTHVRHPVNAHSFSRLLPHFKDAGSWASGTVGISASPRTPDLLAILLLGIGMLSLGLLKKRTEGTNHLSGHHTGTRVPRHP